MKNFQIREMIVILLLSVLCSCSVQNNEIGKATTTEQMVTSIVTTTTHTPTIKEESKQSDVVKLTIHNLAKYQRNATKFRVANTKYYVEVTDDFNSKYEHLYFIDDQRTENSVLLVSALVENGELQPFTTSNYSRDMYYFDIMRFYFKGNDEIPCSTCKIVYKGEDFYVETDMFLDTSSMYHEYQNRKDYCKDDVCEYLYSYSKEYFDIYENYMQEHVYTENSTIYDFIVDFSFEGDRNEKVVCQHNKYVKSQYTLNDKKIKMSSTIGKVDNIFIEPDEENDVLNFYFVYCNVKHLITSLQFISTENYDLANVEIEEPLRSYLDENGLCIYKTSGFFTIGIDYNYLLNEGLQEFSAIYDEETTNSYAKTLNQLFGFNQFNEIERVIDISGR